MKYKKEEKNQQYIEQETSLLTFALDHMLPQLVKLVLLSCSQLQALIGTEMKKTKC